MSLLQWPFVRKYYPGILNPVFLQDIEAANQGLQDAIAVVTGMNNTDFAILSGLDYILGIQNTYTPGWIYFNGQIYYISTSFNELLYLSPTPTDTLSETFEDTIARNIYTINYATAVNTTPGNTPQFSGNMNVYRIGLKYFQNVIALLQTKTANLGTAGNADLGTGAGQVLTADQTYTQAQVNTILAGFQISQVGSVVNFLPLTSGQNTAFLALFNANGEGQTFPYIGWHLLNGLDGYPDMTGTGFVGIGAGYVYNTAGGANSVALTPNNIPPLPNTTQQFFLSSSGSGVMGIATNADNGSALTGLSVNSGSPTTPVNTQDKFLPVYFIYRHT